MTDLFERERDRLVAATVALQWSTVSLSDLADALRLAPASIRQLGIPAHTAGKAGNESRYSRDAVLAYLSEINGRPVTWHDDILLTPREAVVVLVSRGQTVTPPLLAKWRERRIGPPWLRVAPRAIRYWHRGLLNPRR